MDKLSYLLTYTVHFVLITWISELGSVVGTFFVTIVKGLEAVNCLKKSP